MWEESPIGTWYLQVINDGLSYVRLEDWSLSLLGTDSHPQAAAATAAAAAAAPAAVPKQAVAAVKPAVNNNPPPPAQITPSLPTAPVGQPANNLPPPPAAVNPASGNQNLNTAAAALQNCAESDGGPYCSKCLDGFVLLGGKCVDSCPPEGYYQGVVRKSQPSCIKCYYSCKTCNGPNDYQVLPPRLLF